MEFESIVLLGIGLLNLKRKNGVSDINSLELRIFVVNAVKDVFGTMLSMEMEAVDPPLEINGEGGHIVGSVSFAGKVLGNVNFKVNRDFAREMTAAMLGMEVEEIESDEEVHDVIGEVCNMVGGDLKSRLCDAGFECNLSIPTITSGVNFSIESKGWERNEEFGFKNSHHSAFVRVYMKSGNGG